MDIFQWFLFGCIIWGCSKLLMLIMEILDNI
jgi:hypothetical protein